MAFAAQTKISLNQRSSLAVKVQRQSAAKPMARTQIVTKAFSDTNLIIGGSTIVALSLGRFVFLPSHRAALAKAGLPKQNGQSHFEAGDRLAEEVSFLKSNDPSGFNLVDVFSWGAIGHALGFYILATSSISQSPIPF